MKTKTMVAWAVATVLAMSGVALAVDRTWTGAGDDDNWSTGPNWGGTAPVAGDKLIFDGAVRTSTINDLAAGTSFAGLLFNNNGTLSDASFTLSGNSITLGGNIDVIVASSYNINNVIELDMILGGNYQIGPRAGHHITISGAIGEDATPRDLTKVLAGDLYLTGLNTFSGQMQINRATVYVNTLANAGTASSLGTGNTTPTIRIGNNNDLGTLEYAGAANASTDRQVQIGSGTLAGTGNARINSSGDGTVMFTAATFNEAWGATGARTLLLGGTNTGDNEIQGAIVNNTSALVNVQKEGDGTWILSGASTYTGNTTINAGKLVAADDAAFGSVGTVLLNNTGATLELADGVTISRAMTVGNTGNEKYLQLRAGATSAEYSGGIAMDEATSEFRIDTGAGGTLTLSGQFSGTAAGFITKLGDGTLVLSNAGNTYGNAFRVRDGTLKMGVVNAMDVSRMLHLAPQDAGQTPTVDLAGFSTEIASLSLGASTTLAAGLTGQIVDTVGTGTLKLGGDVAYLSGSTGFHAGQYEVGVSVDLNGATRTFNVADSDQTTEEVRVSGTIGNSLSGLYAAGITKTGSGTLVLTGANTYDDVTTVSAGILVVKNNAALGTTAAGTAVSGGALVLDGSGGNLTLAEAISLSGTPAQGALQNAAGNNTLTGAITLTGHTQIGTYGGSLTIDVGSGKAIEGTEYNLYFRAQNGEVTINDEVDLGTGVLTKGYGSNMTLNGAVTYGSLRHLNAVLQVINLPDAPIFIGNGANTCTILFVGTSDVTLTQAITLGRAETNAGASTSIFQNNSDANIMTLSGPITINPDVSLTQDQTFTLAGTNTGDNLVDGVISDGVNGNKVNVSKDGGGTWILDAVNTYSGTTTVSSGLLVVRDNAALGSAAAGTTANGGSVVLDGSGGDLTIAEAFTLSGTQVAGALQNLAGVNTVSGKITLSGNTGIASYGGSLTIDTGGGNAITATGQTLELNGSGGTIRVVDGIDLGAGQLIKSYGSRVTIEGTVAYGSLRHQNGILDLINLPDTPIFIGNAANTCTIVYTGTTDATLASEIVVGRSGGGMGQSTAVFQNDSVANTIALNGGITVDAILDTQLQTLRLGGSNAGANTVGGAMTDGVGGAKMAVEKNDAGTWALTGANSYSGGTTVNSGTLRVNNAIGSGTGSGAVTVKSGATLGGTGIIAGDITVETGGILAPGNSIGTLTGANLTLSEGSILEWELDNDSNLSDRVNLSGQLIANGLSMFDFGGTGYFNGVAPTVYTLITFTDGDFVEASNFSYQNLGSGGLTGQFAVSETDLTLTVIPEPASLGAFGAIALAAILRRRLRR